MLLFWALAAFAVNIGLARFSYGVLLPALRHDFPASYATFGAINALNLGGYLVGTLVAPVFARGRGRQMRAFLIATLVVALMLGLSAVSRGLLLLAVCRTVAGFASAIAIAITAVATFERVLPHHRGGASSAMWAGAAVGILLTGPGAPLSTGPSPMLSWRWEWALMAAVALVVAFGFAATLRSTAPLETPAAQPEQQRSAFDPRDLLRAHRFLYLGLAYMFFGIAYIAYATFAVSLFRAHGVPAAGAGLAWALVGVGGIAGAFGIVHVLESPLRRSALVAAGVMGALGGLLAAGSSLVAIVVSAVLFGFGSVATPAVVTALSRARSTTTAYPGTYASVTALLCAGQFVGPMLAGPLVDHYGLSAAALFTTVVYGLCAFAALLDARYAAV